MMRDELREEIKLILAITRTCGIDGYDATDKVLAIFDRYEREQWRMDIPTWEPSREILVEHVDGTCMSMYTTWNANQEEPWPWPDLTGRWRELPPGPGEG